jgi:hypothetical protein
VFALFIHDPCAPPNNSIEQSLLRSKVIANDRDTNTGPVGDIANGSSFVAAFGKQCLGGIEYALPRYFR